jgi:hypothetical protein
MAHCFNRYDNKVIQPDSSKHEYYKVYLCRRCIVSKCVLVNKTEITERDTIFQTPLLEDPISDTCLDEDLENLLLAKEEFNKLIKEYNPFIYNPGFQEWKLQYIKQLIKISSLQEEGYYWCSYYQDIDIWRFKKSEWYNLDLCYDEGCSSVKFGDLNFKILEGPLKAPLNE